MEFRHLNENEKSYIQSAYRKGLVPLDKPLISFLDHLTVSYEQMQGGFCVRIVRIGYTLYRGASRRSYKDRPNPILGEMLAFKRAILYSRPVGIAGHKVKEGLS